MWRRERFVQVDVHRIDAEITGANAADNRVEIRAIAIDQSAGRVHGVRDFFHVWLEQPARIRIGNHNTGHISTKPRL